MLEVLKAVLQTFYNIILFYTVFMLLTYILISIPLLPHSFIPGLKPSFSANPSHCSLPFLLQD